MENNTVELDVNTSTGHLVPKLKSNKTAFTPNTEHLSANNIIYVVYAHSEEGHKKIKLIVDHLKKLAPKNVKSIDIYTPLKYMEYKHSRLDLLGNGLSTHVAFLKPTPYPADEVILLRKHAECTSVEIPQCLLKIHGHLFYNKATGRYITREHYHQLCDDSDSAPPPHLACSNLAKKESKAEARGVPSDPVLDTFCKPTSEILLSTKRVKEYNEKLNVLKRLEASIYSLMDQCHYFPKELERPPYKFTGNTEFSTCQIDDITRHIANLRKYKRALKEHISLHNKGVFAATTVITHMLAAVEESIDAAVKDYNTAYVYSKGFENGHEVKNFLSKNVFYFVITTELHEQFPGSFSRVCKNALANHKFMKEVKHQRKQKTMKFIFEYLSSILEKKGITKELRLSLDKLEDLGELLDWVTYEVNRIKNVLHNLAVFASEPNETGLNNIIANKDFYGRLIKSISHMDFEEYLVSFSLIHIPHDFVLKYIEKTYKISLDSPVPVNDEIEKLLLRGLLNAADARLLLIGDPEPETFENSMFAVLEMVSKHHDLPVYNLLRHLSVFERFTHRDRKMRKVVSMMELLKKFKIPHLLDRVLESLQGLHISLRARSDLHLACAIEDFAQIVVDESRNTPGESCNILNLLAAHPLGLISYLNSIGLNQTENSLSELDSSAYLFAMRLIIAKRLQHDENRLTVIFRRLNDQACDSYMLSSYSRLLKFCIRKELLRVNWKSIPIKISNEIFSLVDMALRFDNEPLLKFLFETFKLHECSFYDSEETYPFFQIVFGNDRDKDQDLLFYAVKAHIKNNLFGNAAIIYQLMITEAINALYYWADNNHNSLARAMKNEHIYKISGKPLTPTQQTMLHILNCVDHSTFINAWNRPDGQALMSELISHKNIDAARWLYKNGAVWPAEHPHCEPSRLTYPASMSYSDLKQSHSLISLKPASYDHWLMKMSSSTTVVDETTTARACENKDETDRTVKLLADSLKILEKALRQAENDYFNERKTAFTLSPSGVPSNKYNLVYRLRKELQEKQVEALEKIEGYISNRATWKKLYDIITNKTSENTEKWPTSLKRAILKATPSIENDDERLKVLRAYINFNKAQLINWESENIKKTLNEIFNFYSAGPKNVDIDAQIKPETAILLSALIHYLTTSDKEMINTIISALNLLEAVFSKDYSETPTGGFDILFFYCNELKNCPMNCLNLSQKKLLKNIHYLIALQYQYENRQHIPLASTAQSPKPLTDINLEGSGSSTLERSLFAFRKTFDMPGSILKADNLAANRLHNLCATYPPDEVEVDLDGKTVTLLHHPVDNLADMSCVLHSAFSAISGGLYGGNRVKIFINWLTNGLDRNFKNGMSTQETKKLMKILATITGRDIIIWKGNKPNRIRGNGLEPRFDLHLMELERHMEYATLKELPDSNHVDTCKEITNNIWADFKKSTATPANPTEITKKLCHELKLKSVILYFNFFCYLTASVVYCGQSRQKKSTLDLILILNDIINGDIQVNFAQQTVARECFNIFKDIHIYFTSEITELRHAKSKDDFDKFKPWIYALICYSKSSCKSIWFLTIAMKQAKGLEELMKEEVEEKPDSRAQIAVTMGSAIASCSTPTNNEYCPPETFDFSNAAGAAAGAGAGAGGH